MNELGSAIQMHLVDVERSSEKDVPKLQAVHDCSLYRKLDELQDRYHYADESSFFAGLVNTSTVYSRPFHRWARYREGYSPVLVHELIRRSNLDRSRHYVMDPMCGSGTTVVASNEIGFDALGCDVNPYAVDLANAKTGCYRALDLEQLYDLVLKVASESEKHQFKNEAEIRKYFPPSNIEELLVIRRAIERLSSRSAFLLAKMAWLSIIEDCSDRKKDGNGLATVPSRVTDVRAFYIAKLNTFISDVEGRNVNDGVKGTSVECSALSCEIAARAFEASNDKRAGAVIFSPPYANSFDYFESYKLELLLGEYCDIESLVTKRTNAVRNYRICYGYELQSAYELVEMTCGEIMSAVPEKEKLTGKRDARTRIVPNLLRGYFDDMHKSLESIFASLVSGGRCFIVVDQSAYVGIVVATDLILAALGEQVGFNVDVISKCRRANTSGQQLKRFPHLRECLRESIVALSKP
jgi:SAM-dependent methyltransferase